MKRFRWNSIILTVLVFSLLSFGNLAIASSDGKGNQGGSEIAVTIDKRPIYFDVAPQQIDGRVMVPLRAIFESLGAEVGWDGSTQTITGKKDDIAVTLRLNDTKAEVGSKTVTLDVAATQIEGRTFVPARFVAESFGADVKWNESLKQVIITTGAAAPEGHYYFIYNSQKVTAQDMASIKLFANKFRQTYNVLLDAAQYKTATELYDALKTEQKKLGGTVAGIQIFGLASDVPSFTYTHKMKFLPANFEWDGVEENKEKKFVSDLLYANFKNDSKYLKDVSVYGIVQENLPISVIPEWPVSRLPLTKGEIAKYIDNYDAYRKQSEGKSVPTVAVSAPYQIQDGYAQDDIALFIKRLTEDEFGLFKDTERRTYYKDHAMNLTKENKVGVMDLVVDGRGDKNGAEQDKVLFFDRNSVVDLNANYYTAFLWGFDAAADLDANSVVHDGLSKGKMINPIAHTVPQFGRGVLNYLWLPVPTPEGEKDGDWNDYVAVDKEHLEMDNPFFFVYKYYEAIESGKTRLQSFFEADAAYATLTVANKNTSRFLFGFECMYSAAGFENLFSMHYLGLADYE
ncbi:copper amine oxidase N-terminal domain-containing protein [Paenibacillus albiflavus]|uniref:Copper amine oxidase N-terminal domain-containing protein n=1 Tax=Paenibacillus albiflavus TaxID=2545760 RepID=A0A4R4EDR2_9BACL|nr:copper amine oxidase N-terminal domain-containing protein [Paenibacillus albiflavus]TCZ78134.1 copper amine oxidase N-terminal domain-containing protein [Paenibacillus albiflavus]